MLDLKNIKKKYLIAGFLVFSVVVYGATYAFCSTSKAFEKASGFVSTNEEISNQVGAIKRQRLGFYNFNISQNMKGGMAQFTIVISGEKASAEVRFELVKASEIWEIKKALLKADDQSISLK